MKLNKRPVIITLIIIVILVGVFLGFSFYQKECYLKKYNNAKTLIEEHKYDSALSLLDDLHEYKDSDKLIEKAENGKLYDEAVAFYNNKEYEKAISDFSKLSDYEDSKELLKDSRYLLAEEYYNAGKYGKAKKIFVDLDGYKDSSLYLAKINLQDITASKNRIYQDACAKYNSGDYENALSAFKSILDYEDSDELYNKCKLILRRKDTENVLAAGVNNDLAVLNDGTVLAAGDNSLNQNDVSDWKDIVSVSAYGCLSIGLKKDGDVLITGKLDDNDVEVSDWNSIVDVAAGERFVLGLKSDGTVMAAGHNGNHQLEVSDWKNVISITAGWSFSVALTEDQQLLFAGLDHGQKEQFEQEKGKWKNVVNISASGGGNDEHCRGKGHTVGLCEDGTVVAIGDNTYGQCDVSEWTDIVKVAAGDWYTVGLKGNGDIVITGKNFPGSKYIDSNILEQCHDIVDIAAGFGQTVCLKKDGTVIAFGFDDEHKISDMHKWKNVRMPRYS